jgi:hypothetical protein
MAIEAPPSPKAGIRRKIAVREAEDGLQTPLYRSSGSRETALTVTISFQPLDSLGNVADNEIWLTNGVLAGGAPGPLAFCADIDWKRRRDRVAIWRSAFALSIGRVLRW